MAKRRFGGYDLTTKNVVLDTNCKHDTFVLAIVSAKRRCQNPDMKRPYDDILSKVENMITRNSDRITLCSGHRNIAINALKRFCEKPVIDEYKTIAEQLLMQLSLTRREYREWLATPYNQIIK